MLAQKASTLLNTQTDLNEPNASTDSDSKDAPQPQPAQDGPNNKERRLAPRSSNQFRVGPPFSATIAELPVYVSNLKVPVTPQISARLDRGFDMIEGEWIGYKRNYFTLVAAFKFAGVPLDTTSTELFEYSDELGARHKVHAFKISLTSVCLEDSATAVTLVQHTAKRDRGPQSSPPLYYAVPGELPAHTTMKLVANIRNGDKIDRCNRLFYLLKEDHKRAVREHPQCVLATYPETCEISLVARYERIQFLSAGCGNRKLASTNNKHYILVVQLLGVTNLGLHVLLASTQSPPLIVRGRSPSNYPLSVKKEPKLTKAALAKSNTASSRTRESQDPENDAENHNVPRKKKFKPSTAHLPRVPLGVNQNILNSYTSQAVDPVLARDLQKGRVLGTLVAGLIPDGNIPDGNIPDDNIPAEIHRERHPLENKMEFVELRCPSSKKTNDSLVIPQEPLFPFVADSPSFGRSILLLTNGEPMNINHSGFQSSQERLQKAIAECDNSILELENILDADLANAIDCYLSVPVPMAFPDTLRTSTPLQLQVMDRPAVMRPNILRNLHPPVARCKHGFKQREKATTAVHRSERFYTFADLDNGCQGDASFLGFQSRLASYKLCIRDGQSPHSSSIRLSPLTMLNSDHEALILNRLRERCEGDELNRA